MAVVIDQFEAVADAPAAPRAAAEPRPGTALTPAQVAAPLQRLRQRAARLRAH
jgi:hypothetical protein